MKLNLWAVSLIELKRVPRTLRASCMKVGMICQMQQGGCSCSWAIFVGKLPLTDACCRYVRMGGAPMVTADWCHLFTRRSADVYYRRGSSSRRVSSRLLHQTQTQTWANARSAVRPQILGRTPRPDSNLSRHGFSSRPTIRFELRTSLRLHPAMSSLRK